MLCYVYLADVTERQDDDGRECRIVEQQRDKQHSHEDRQDCGTSSPDPQHYSRSLYGVLTAYIMSLIAVYYIQAMCTEELAGLYTAINSLSANHAYLKTLYGTTLSIRLITDSENIRLLLSPVSAYRSAIARLISRSLATAGNRRQRLSILLCVGYNDDSTSIRRPIH